VFLDWGELNLNPPKYVSWQMSERMIELDIIAGGKSMSILVKGAFLIHLASLGFQVMQTSIREESVAGVELIVEHRVTDFPYIADDVVVVPGEQRVLYLRETGDGNVGIFQKGLASRIDGPLIEYVKPGIISNLSVSADGTKIAFSVGGITQWYPTDVYVADTSGRNIRKLTESRFVGQPPDPEKEAPRIIYDRAYTALAISPDGTKVALSINDNVKTERYLAVINSDGTGLRELGKIGSFLVRWSPDGRRLFTIYQGKLIECDLGSGKTSVLDQGAGDTLIVSPQGDKLYYYKSGELTEHNFVTGKKRMVHRTMLTHLAISPSSQRFVASSNNQLMAFPSSGNSFTRMKLPVANRLGLYPSQEQVRSETEKESAIEHIEWIDENQILCVTSNKGVVKIGVISVKQ
jgi:hypothetical protein